MRTFMMLFALAACSQLSAQYTVRIQIAALPAGATTEQIYVAGNFNGWNPADETFKLVKNEMGGFSLTMKNIPAGDYEFKFTKGSWQTVEMSSDGNNVPNRKLSIQSDTVLTLSIGSWASGAIPVKKHTAGKNVRIIDTAFFIPQLNRTRRIWIYLPEGYATGTKRYPVMYMHDGQNLFDEATAFAGEWGVDEALDSFSKKCIVIGIDNGGLKRMNEYNPYNNQRFGKGEGKQYIDFIAKTLKPYIDKKYRTLKDKNNTIIAGSSMGGLISMYAAVKYPQVFGVAGVFSPSFWIAPELLTEIKKTVKASTHRQSRIYFYAGEQESKELVRETLQVFETMRMKAGCKMEVRINAEGQHNEPTWRVEFPGFYKWF
jgi:predicted alpha/beta superfamily hydrolase